MTELDLKQIRKRAMDEIEQNKKHPFHYEGDNFSDDVIDLLDRLEKAERKLEETTIELGKVCWESTAKINERDAQLENTESLIAQLTEEIAYGNKVIAEKDAQLEKSYVDRNALTRKQARIGELEGQLVVCIEALKNIANWKASYYDNRDNEVAENMRDDAKEALEKVGKHE